MDQYKSNMQSAMDEVNKINDDTSFKQRIQEPEAPVSKEKRLAPDGKWYTKKEFIQYYNSNNQWLDADPNLKDISSMILEHRIELKSIELN